MELALCMQMKTKIISRVENGARPNRSMRIEKWHESTTTLNKHLASFCLVLTLGCDNHTVSLKWSSALGFGSLIAEVWGRNPNRKYAEFWSFCLWPSGHSDDLLYATKQGINMCDADGPNMGLSSGLNWGAYLQGSWIMVRSILYSLSHEFYCEINYSSDIKVRWRRQTPCA